MLFVIVALLSTCSLVMVVFRQYSRAVIVRRIWYLSNEVEPILPSMNYQAEAINKTLLSILSRIVTRSLTNCSLCGPMGQLYLKAYFHSGRPCLFSKPMGKGDCSCRGNGSLEEKRHNENKYYLMKSKSASLQQTSKTSNTM